MSRPSPVISRSATSEQNLLRPKSNSNILIPQNSNSNNNDSKKSSKQLRKNHSTDEVSKKVQRKDRPRSVSSSSIVIYHNNSQRPFSVGSSERLNTASSSCKYNRSRPPSCGSSSGSLRRFNSEERIRSTVCIYTGSSGLLPQTNGNQG